ncbi:syntaxin-16 isoform X2 [Exaiptasia diaphana]|uniref:Syntaxin-16 n=1 Tax=Exaiptasia diaphana TaxID=2652724 RepID=A0A913WRH6_EXADI|nr:syntaxin-16 isoform X2 [Exaiptasia diaphana]
MATRTLTDVYFNLRTEISRFKAYSLGDSAVRTSCEGLYAPYSQDDDTVALVQKVDPESGTQTPINTLPPQWTDSVEEIQYDITRIKQRMTDLSTLHDRHLNRPTLDDSVDEEQTIEITTKEITQMFHQCQNAIQRMSKQSRGASKQEQRILKNVTSSLAVSLQDLSTNFRKSQSSYLKRLKNREERERQFFDTGLPSTSSALMNEDVVEDDDLYDRGFTSDQMRLVEDNSAIIELREKEIQSIVQSISELNEIFRDLATMIVEQGTILDRIDYNVEQASVKVEQGLEQLKKAEQHQKSSRKMLCIIFLSVVVIIMLVALVITKSK